MYVETLIPWSEVIVMACIVIPALLYMYRNRSPKQYSIVRLLRSMDRTHYTWAPTPKASTKRRKTVLVAKGVYIDGIYHAEWYIKQ